jgi:hypothetical protein
MKAVARFALAQHQGPYEAWPVRTSVIIDSQLSELTIPGFTLLRQYETTAGYLLVTDFDCPFEEAVCFALIDKDFRTVLSERTVGQWYNSYILDEVEWLDDKHFFATFHDQPEYRYEFTIRKYNIPLIYPRLGLTCRCIHEW